MTKGLKEFRFTLSLIAYRSGDEQMRCWQSQRRRRLPAIPRRCYNGTGDLLMAKQSYRVAWGLVVVLAVALLSRIVIMLVWIPPERARAIAIAKQAVAANDTWANRATYEAERTATGCFGLVERKEGLFGLSRVPGGYRHIEIDHNGKVVSYSRGY